MAEKKERDIPPLPKNYVCINCYAAGGYLTQGDKATARRLHGACINNDLPQLVCTCAHVMESE